MGALHWLILFPVYFFGAITLHGVLGVSSRMMRRHPHPERIVGWAVGGSLLGLSTLLLVGVVSIEDFTLLRVVALGVLSFVVAGAAPLPLEQSGRHHHTSDPQVL